MHWYEVRGAISVTMTELYHGPKMLQTLLCQQAEVLLFVKNEALVTQSGEFS